MKKIIMGFAAMAMAMSLSAAEYNWGLNGYNYVGPSGEGYVEEFGGNFYSGGYAMLFLGTVSATENAFTLDGTTFITAGGYDEATFSYGVNDPGAGLASDKVTSTAAGQAFSIVILDKVVANLDGYTGNYAIINGTSAEQLTNPGTGGFVAQFVDSNPLTQSQWNTMTSSAVPEPTSGLLLLLGVAGLALRRRRA